MKNTINILIVLLLSTVFCQRVFAVEVKWEDDTVSYYNSLFNKVTTDYLDDYKDYRQLCVDGTSSPKTAHTTDYQNSAACHSHCYGDSSDPATCASCKTFKFYKVGPFRLVSWWEPGRRCLIKNDLGYVRDAFEAKRLIRCDSSSLWTRSQLSEEAFHANACSAKPINKPKGAAGSGCPNSPNTKYPISIAYGNKHLNEADYQSPVVLGLKYSRFYNSFLSGMYAATNNIWYGSSKVHFSVVSSSSLIYVVRADRKIFQFTKSNNVWLTDADISDRLVELKDTSDVTIGWQYITAKGNSIETYNAEGFLTRIEDKAGNNVTYTLSDSNTPATIAYNPNLPISMTDHVGRSLHFTYDAFDRIATMTNPQGGLYQYTYDANSSLVSVTYPDQTVKTYHYGGEASEAANVSATPESGVDNNALLTGITDENGDRYATYRYDAKGRAYDEELAPDLGSTLGQKIEHNNLVYNVDGNGNPTSTIVTDGRNTQHTYNFTTILGVVKSTGTDQPAGSGCAASGSNITYDANGNISSKTDFNGNKTTYVYDMSRNLETSRTEGLTTAGAATAATRTITTSWHPTWRLPLTVSEYAGNSASGTALRITTTTYDDKGNITSVTEADPVNNTSRTVTTTYTYSTAVPGLVLTKVVDGPRTDVNDITTYQYYPHDAVCEDSTATPIIDPITNSSPANLGCRGQLSSITNAAGQITSYDRYNHHGQIEQMTDANGLVTTNTYDLRQRLLSRTVGTETTTLTYDNVGQVIHLTLPDNSQLNYSYDAAHRLTDIIDNLGNRIHYTLDAQGNRINENITDPSNQLTKTVTRGYDALNRLQQVTGIE